MADCSDTRRVAAEKALKLATNSADAAAIEKTTEELAAAKKHEDDEVTAVLAAVTATI